MTEKVFNKREDIQNKVRELCTKFYNEHEDEIKEDKVGNKIVERGFIKNMFSFVYEAYTSKVIVSQYIGIDLWNICVVGEAMLELCAKYNAIPNRTLLSIITGVPVYLLGKIENSQDHDTISRMDAEYNQDYKEYFKRVYNIDKTRTIHDKVNINSNIEHAYPVYCILKQIREIEKDGRIERGKLGDITQLNAPIELGGFGFAHPTIMVDNRQLIIGDEQKLISTYATAQKHINDVKVEKEELKEEAVDLFKDCNE